MCLPSALALCVSFVSALSLSVDADVKLGAQVAVDVAVATGDPARVGLQLVRPNVDVNLDLLVDVDVAATIDVTIPADIAAV